MALGPPGRRFFIPTVDLPEPAEVGRLYAADGSLLLVLFERQPVGFVPD